MTRSIAVCLVVALALRMPFLLGPLESDEAGMLLVVRHWDPDAGHLYGDYWVDRPPLLLAYFWLADLLPGAVGVRLLGCGVAVVLVLAALLAGRVLGGPRGAFWAGLVAAAVGSSYVVAGHALNGTLQAATMTMASCSLTVAATYGRPSPARLWSLCLAAGALGACGVMVKQNFFDGLVFGLVVLVAAVLTGRLSRGQALSGLAAGLAGALAVLAAVLAWAAAVGVDLGELWFALYEFRGEAAQVIAEDRKSAPLDRLLSLTAAFVVSGLAFALALFFAGYDRLAGERAVRPYAAGIVGLMLVAFLGIVLGGSFWRHYLIQLIPTAVLVVALVAPRPGRWGASMRVVGVVAVVSAVAGAVHGAGVETAPRDEVLAGRYLDAATQEGDTGLVTWGSAEILFYADVRSPYRHLWSLPIRTLDPDLAELRRTLAGEQAPTWIVEWHSFSSWDLDGDGGLTDLVGERYREVGTVCGRSVYLLEGVERRLPEPPECG